MIEPNSSPPGIVQTAAPQLKELAKEINGMEKKAKARLRLTLNDFRQVGIRLIRAKERVGHGFWLSWIYHHLNFSKRKAQLYMQIARHWPQLKSATIAHLNDAVDFLKQDFGEEIEPPQRMAGDEPESLDESPLEIATSKGRRATKEETLAWKRWDNLFGKIVLIPETIARLKPDEGTATERKKFESAFEKAQAAFGEWKQRIVTEEDILSRR